MVRHGGGSGVGGLNREDELLTSTYLGGSGGGGI